MHPFHGVHAAAAPTTLIDLCHAYAVRMRTGQSFCHATAAQLHGMPLPARLQQLVPVHVAAVRPASPPRTRGVVGHRLSAQPVLQTIGGLVVCVPSEAWVQLADDLDLDELVEVADHLLTVSPLGPDATRALLRRRIEAVRRRASGRLHAALELARCPVLSPGETRVRLLLVRGGIPEPECNGKVFRNSDGTYLGKPDLVWRRARVAVEYEGGGHADPRRMRMDIARYEAFREEGWIVLRVTSDDLLPTRRTLLVARVETALANR